MTPRPADPELYEKIKSRLYAEMPTHSAYRSGLLVQRYKAAGGTYLGPKPKTSDPGLARWYAEHWTQQEGKIGYHRKGDVYRPTKRVTSKTPATFDEITPAELARARAEKKRTGRVRRFKN